MAVTHMTRLFRKSEGDLGDGLFPVMDADDGEAIAQAKSLLRAHFIGKPKPHLKPTQAIVTRLDADGRETRFHRLACYSPDDIRSFPLDQDPPNKLQRIE